MCRAENQLNTNYLDLRTHLKKKSSEDSEDFFVCNQKALKQ